MQKPRDLFDRDREWETLEAAWESEKAELVFILGRRRVGQWWSADSTQEVDIVALGGHGQLLVGECKWGSVTTSDLADLRDRATLLTRLLSGIRTVHLALFTGEAAVGPDVRSAVEAGEVLQFGPDDLLGSSD